MQLSDDFSSYEALKKEINFHNYRYHVLDDPVVSDGEFDRMLARLREIEDSHPDWISPVSPTQRSGAPPADKFVKVSHPERILSLANAFSEDDIEKWFDRIAKLDERVRQTQFVLEPKIDGLTVVLHYQKGVLVLGATRGDGETGEDITENIRTIPSVPLKIPVAGTDIDIPEKLVVRTEAFISIKDFELLNERLSQKGKKTYQNPRNTAAGSLRVLDSSLVAKRPLQILAYSIVGDNPMPTQWDTLNYLKALGFPVSNGSEKCDTLKDMLTCLKKWSSYRDTLGYEIDGVVIKVNDLQIAGDLGFVGKDPRGAIALKFPAQEVTTSLNDIRVNVGRTGVLTPYAVLEPVEIGGVIVKQATLHNFDFIAEKDIRIGDRILIKRAGEVIPYVIGPITDARTGDETVFNPPAVCPSCGKGVRTLPGEVAWYCVNNACPAQIIRNIEHFVSRGAMDIEGLGIKIVEHLIDANLIGDIADLYALKKDDLMALEGFAEKKAENILSAIQSSKDQALSKFITALGIHGIGEVAAEELALRYGNVEAISRATAKELEIIEGFGPNTAESIVQWFSTDRNRQVISKLRSLGVWPINQAQTTPAVHTLDGLRFVVTGTLSEFSRDEIKTYIKRYGGKVSDSVSGKTDYLVSGENPGSKLDKANMLDIKIINEADLKDLAEAGDK